VAGDANKTHPESMAALAAAGLALGHRPADHGGAGHLREIPALTAELRRHPDMDV